MRLISKYHFSDLKISPWSEIDSWQKLTPNRSCRDRADIQKNGISFRAINSTYLLDKKQLRDADYNLKTRFYSGIRTGVTAIRRLYKIHYVHSPHMVSKWKQQSSDTVLRTFFSKMGIHPKFICGLLSGFY